MFDKNIFSTRLLELKKTRNLFAKDIANAVGISKQAYSLLEKSKNYPHCNTLVALADYFDVSTDYLLGRSDDPTRH